MVVFSAVLALATCGRAHGAEPEMKDGIVLPSIATSRASNAA